MDKNIYQIDNVRIQLYSNSLKILVYDDFTERQSQINLRYAQLDKINKLVKENKNNE